MFANNFSRKAMTNTDSLLKSRDIPLSSYYVPVCAGLGQHSRLCCVLSHVPTLCDPMDCSPPGSSVHGDSPGQDTGVGCHALLQGIFPTLGSNPGLLHCRPVLYQLSHQGSSQLLEWVAYPFFRGYSRPRNRTRVSCIAGGFFTS